MRYTNCSDLYKTALSLLFIISVTLSGVEELTAQNLSFHPRFYTLKDDSSLKETFIYPLAGWNENDHWMPGVYFTNQLLDKKKLRYQLMPLYSSDTKSLVGTGKMSFNQYYDNRSFSNVSLFIQGKSFHLPAFKGDPLRYYQLETGIKATVEKGSDSIPAQHTFELKFHQNGTEEINYMNDGSVYVPVAHHKILKAIRADWVYEKFDPTQPFSTSVKADVWGDFARMSAHYEYDYNYEPKRWFTFRAFAGIFFFYDSVFAQNYDARFSPNMPGWKTDIFYDGWFPGRNVYDAVYLMQGMPGPGSLYSISPVGQSWNWTVSMSGSVSMPFDLPLRVYAAAGISPDPLRANKPFGIFEGGLLITTPQKIFEIAFPLVHDKSSKEALLLNTDKYWQRIRFIVNFDCINPHTWLDNPYRRKQLHLI